MPENTLFTVRTDEDKLTLFDPASSLWKNAQKITIDRFPSGEHAFSEKGYGWTNLTQVSSVWNELAIFFFFECWHSRSLASGTETPVNQVNDSEPETATLVLRPEGCENYFRITVDSMGNQSSAHVLQLSTDVDRDWDPATDIRILHSDTEKIWRAFLRLPYEPMVEDSRFGRCPEVGDAWRLDLHRTAGHEETRELLSWRPAKSGLLVSGHLIFIGVV